jgi:hypothetical protein
MNSLPPRSVVFKAIDSICKNNVRWLSNTSAEIDGIMVSCENGGAICCSECKDFLSHHAISMLMLKKILPVDERIRSSMEDMDLSQIKETVMIEERVKLHLKSKGVSEDYVDRYIEKIMRLIRESRKNGGLKSKERDNSQSLLLSFK